MRSYSTVCHQRYAAGLPRAISTFVLPAWMKKPTGQRVTRTVATYFAVIKSIERKLGQIVKDV